MQCELQEEVLGLKVPLTFPEEEAELDRHNDLRWMLTFEAQVRGRGELPREAETHALETGMKI